MSGEGHPQTRRMMERAIRRLSVFEYVLMGGAMVFALLGGAAVAWLLETAAGVPFRISWFVSSLLLFVIPGAIVLGREARAGLGSGAEAQTRTQIDGSESTRVESDG
ncbi:MAG: hypothetical protein V3T24_09720 [Longimicrobiales bacterium]